MQRGSLKVVKNRRGVKVWRAQWRENGRGRTRILGTYVELSRGEARSQLDIILSPINIRQASVPPADVTLRRYVEDEYLVVRSRKWKASTRATTEQIIEQHILCEIGFRSVSSLTRRDLQMLLDSKAATGLSLSVVGHIRWQLLAIFEMAISDQIIDANPATSLVIPRCQQEVDKRVITRDDIRRAQMVLEVRERLIFHLAVRRGMRPGEIVGIRLGDIEDHVIHVRRRIYRGVVDTPKSKKSTRPIPVTKVTAALLAEYLELLPDRRPEAWPFRLRLARPQSRTPTSTGDPYSRG